MKIKIASILFISIVFFGCYKNTLVLSEGEEFTSDINSIAARDNLVIAANLVKGILRSTDGGVTWDKMINNPLNNDILNCVTFTDSSILIGGSKGRFTRSIDYGKTWSDPIVSPTNENANDIVFDDNIIVAVFDKGIILVSDSDGTNWRLIDDNPFYYLENILCIDKSGSLVIAAGSGGKLSRSLDSGLTWSEFIDTPFESSSIYGLSIYNDVVLIVGADGKIARSTDGGITFGPIYKIENHLIDVCLVGQKALAVGYAGTILRSINGGITWELSSEWDLEFDYEPGVYRSVCFDQNKFYIAGSLTQIKAFDASSW